MANNSPLAMGASVWTENISLALEVAGGLQAGTVWVNSHGTIDAAAGFGGGKLSGSGRVGSRRVRGLVFWYVCVCMCVRIYACVH